MSSWGRCQDALHELYEYPTFTTVEDGPVKAMGITWEQWQYLSARILETIYPIAVEAGRQQERLHPRTGGCTTISVDDL